MAESQLPRGVVVTSDGATRLEKTVLHETKWIRLSTLKYRDQTGVERFWDMAERSNVSTELDCVDICPILKREGHEDLVIVELQYRPPINGLSLEFPSGLVDHGEDAAAAALRELKEETGYSGIIKEITPAFSLEAGLTNEVSKLVVVEIDGDSDANRNATQQLEGSELIELIYLPLNRLFDCISEVIKSRNCIPDAKLYTFALAQRIFSQQKK